MALHRIPSCYSVKYNHMCSGVIWKTIFCEHSLMLHQEMPFESLLLKEKALHQFYVKMLASSLGLSSSQMV